MAVSITHKTAADGTFTPTGAAAWDDSHSVVGAAEQTSLDAVSAAVEALSALLSTQTSALVANSAQMTSADNAVSAAVAALSAQHTSLAGSVAGALSAITANSAQMTSADNAVSNAVSIVSQAVSVVSAAQAVTSAAVTSVNAVVSNRTSAITANSAQMTSADNAISAVAANALSVGNAASQAASVVSVQAAVATSIANAVSARLSALVLDSVLNVSVPSPGDLQVLTWNSAQAQWVASTITAGVGSVTSAEVVDAVSVETANRVSADNVVSAALATLSTANSVAHTSIMSAISVNSAQMTSADNAISNQVSINGAKISSGLGLSVQIRRYGGIASISAAALTNIPSLSLSLETGGAYIIDGNVVFDGLVSGTWGWGVSVPTLAGATGSYMRIMGMSVTPAQTTGGAAIGQVAFSAFAAGQSVVLSTSAAAGPAGFNAVDIKGFLNVSTGGVFQVMAKGSTAGTITLLITSGYIRAYRIG